MGTLIELFIITMLVLTLVITAGTTPYDKIERRRPWDW